MMDGPEASPVTLLLAHGAGAGMEHEFMTSIAMGLATRGIRVIRFECPYMLKRREDGKKRPPDRMPKLLAAFREQLEAVSRGSTVVIGGKSMGGRVASLLAVEKDVPAISGLVCLGFPFHPPGKPERFRGAHLFDLQIPALILQGERDSFGNREELATFQLGERTQCAFLPDGDHGFKPRKCSGITYEQNLAQAVELISHFILTVVEQQGG
jgi:hypothetical protein